MSRAHLLAAVALVFATGLATTPGFAKRAAAPPTSTTVTQHDVRDCIGTDGSSPQVQIAACTKIINSGKIHHPHEGDYYATRGAAYYATNQYDAALADYNKALTFQQNGEFYFQRALVLLAKAEIDKAKADLATVIKLRSDFSPAYFIRGLIGYQASDYKSAIADFDAAIKTRPTYYQAIFARGVAKSRLGDDSGSEDDLKLARGIGVHVDDDMRKLGVVP